MSIKLFSNQLYYKTSSFGFCFSMCVVMLKDGERNEFRWFGLVGGLDERLACTQKHNTTSVNNGFPIHSIYLSILCGNYIIDHHIELVSK